MRCFRIEDSKGESLIIRRDDDYFDVTAVDPSVTSYVDLASAANISGLSIDALAERLCSDAPRRSVDVETHARMPIVPDEVWGAGVTYEISQESREDDGGLAESYAHILTADRPEIYFKATPSRTVGPGEAVGIRGDSDWDAPEPELSIVLINGDVAGYTIGNDVCSRSLEQENLLYMPQSKTYDRCCAIGPCIATPETIGDPHDLEMTMTIERDGRTTFHETTSTAEMVRTCDDLVSYLTRHNTLPETTVFLTGTSLITPPEFTLQDGDLVRIHIERIGTLTNIVTTV